MGRADFSSWIQGMEAILSGRGGSWDRDRRALEDRSGLRQSRKQRKGNVGVQGFLLHFLFSPRLGSMGWVCQHVGWVFPT